MSLDLLPHFFFALSDGGRLRYAQLAPPSNPRGTVLVVPGAREFIEKKYAEVGRPLLDRGFRVIIVEPRGQGLSSRFLSDGMRQRGHIDDFATYISDLRAFHADVVAPGLTEPLIVHGHSLGAHILLRWLAEDQPKVAGAFVTSPMLAMLGMAAQVATYGLSWINVHLFSHETSYAPMQHDFGGEDLVFANNPLTHDETRFKILEDYFTTHPDLAAGGVTWGWMLAALRSMHEANTWPYWTRVKLPVLALLGDQDIVTPSAEISPYLNQIPRVRTHIISGARHDLMSETDSMRTEAWGHIDEFLKMIMQES
jgi:lysophospholipase